jgi:hypothetical protein
MNYEPNEKQAKKSYRRGGHGVLGRGGSKSGKRDKTLKDGKKKEKLPPK